jgi:alpha-galactosidase
MKDLADYVHSKGLKLGIYSCAGSKTCGGRPGSRGHEYQDALTYAKWGIDYLKYDWCNTEGLNAEGAYITMRDAIFAAGHPVVFSICEWGNNKPWQWGAPTGHLWRTAGDIYNCFDCIKDHGTWKSWGVTYILDMQDSLRKYAGPGHWNDPDMLEVGNSMTVNEDRAHFSMWCMLAAPLIAGNDIRNMSKETKYILTNRDVLAVNQDSLGIQGFKYNKNNNVESWFKPLANGDWAVCILNRDSTAQIFNINWKNEKVSDKDFGKETNFEKITYRIRNLWTKEELGNTNNSYNTIIPAHDIVMLRLIK